MALTNTRFHAPGSINVLSSGRFYPNSTSAPTGIVGLAIKGVARTGVGTFKVSLKEPWRKCLALKAILAHSTSDAFDAIIVSHQVTSKTDPSFVVKVCDGSGAGHDYAANSNVFVMLRMALAEGSVF